MHNIDTLDIQCQFVNVSNNCCSSLYKCSGSVWISEQRNKLSISRIVLCTTSKPLKSVALSNVANVSIGWILSLIGGPYSIRIISKISSTSSNITTQYSSMFFIINNLIICSCLLVRWNYAKYTPTNYVCTNGSSSKCVLKQENIVLPPSPP